MPLSSLLLFCVQRTNLSTKFTYTFVALLDRNRLAAQQVKSRHQTVYLTDRNRLTAQNVNWRSQTVGLAPLFLILHSWGHQVDPPRLLISLYLDIRYLSHLSQKYIQMGKFADTRDAGGQAKQTAYIHLSDA